MKTLIVILIIASFLQSTIFPIELVLLILICRTYIRNSKSNLYLALAFGLFLSFLNLSTLGFKSIVFLIIIQATRMLSKSRLAGNPLLIMPVSLLFLTLNHLINFPVNIQTPHFPKLFLESFLSIPILYIVRLWEERFIVQKGIKLKV